MPSPPSSGLSADDQPWNGVTEPLGSVLPSKLGLKVYPLSKSLNGTLIQLANNGNSSSWVVPRCSISGSHAQKSIPDMPVTGLTGSSGWHAKASQLALVGSSAAMKPHSCWPRPPVKSVSGEFIPLNAGN